MSDLHAVVSYDTSYTPARPRKGERAVPPAPPARLPGRMAVPPLEQSFLSFNELARSSLDRPAARGATLHFTFGSSIMTDFVRNWVHFVRKAGLSPVLIGAADAALLEFCDREGLPAAAIKPELDVWTYQRREELSDKVYTMHAKWKYFRHHDSDFLEMGLIKV